MELCYVYVMESLSFIESHKELKLASGYCPYSCLYISLMWRGKSRSLLTASCFSQDCAQMLRCCSIRKQRMKWSVEDGGMLHVTV